jgi:hypothetical protein
MLLHTSDFFNLWLQHLNSPNFVSLFLVYQSFLITKKKKCISLSQCSHGYYLS